MNFLANKMNLHECTSLSWKLQSCLHYLIHRPEAYDRSLIHAIESVIIDWTHQIRDVLKKDSAQPLLEGLNPTPMVEIEFWKAKAQNLDCIYEQLRDSKVRKMAEMLEKANSSYFPSFKNIFRDVVEGTFLISDMLYFRMRTSLKY